MLKRKKNIVGLLAITLSVSILSSNAALAASTTASKDPDVELSVMNEYRIGTDKNNIKWSYKFCKDGTISIFKSENADLGGSIEIPSKIDGLTVSGIEPQGLWNCTKITSVKIPATIKTIGELAFYGCTSLSNIEIPSSVTDIGASAFENTPWLTSQRNSNKFVVVNNILIDGRSATGNITIPSNVTTIGKYAFADANIRYKHNTDYTYGNSGSITSVIIPEGVKKIDEGAFYRCNNLNNIKIPSSVTKIEASAFYNTTWINSLRANNQFVIVNNILIDDGMRAVGDVTIPSNVVSISGRAFQENQGITSLKIPGSVKEIGKEAFIFCPKLKSIEISSGLTSIGDSSFSMCNNLSEISIPDSVVNIDKYAFSMCDNLSKVRLSKNIKTIKMGTFDMCKNLTNIDIPSGVTQIGDNAFGACYKLTKVRFPASVAKISDNAFDMCENLIAAYCDKNSYSNNYFKNKGINVEKYDKYSSDDSDIDAGSMGIAIDENNVKWKYTKLSDYTLSISLVGESYSGIIKIPSQLKGYKVTVIGEKAFSAQDITGVKIPEGVKEISDYAFSSCGKIVSVEIPASVTNIGKGAFGNSMGLGSVTIPNKSVTLGEYAFSTNTKVNIGIFSTKNTDNQNTSKNASSNTESNSPKTPSGIQELPKVPQGWHKDGYYWNWLWSDGTKRTGWYEESGKWYYFYGNGQMATEFIDLGGYSYYFEKNSADGKTTMATGWKYIQGKWFYFNPNSDGYKGLMKRACWANIDGNWYYFYYDGQMARNTWINGYYVNSSGAWVK